MDTGQIIAEAITRKVRVRAIYNKVLVVLAPHILYKKHEQIYVDAVTITRDGEAPRDVKIGTFKLDGLREPRLDAYRFKPFPHFSVADPKYAGSTLLSVEG